MKATGKKKFVVLLVLALVVLAVALVRREKYWELARFENDLLDTVGGPMTYAGNIVFLRLLDVYKRIDLCTYTAWGAGAVAALCAVVLVVKLAYRSKGERMYSLVEKHRAGRITTAEFEKRKQRLVE